MGRDPSLIFPIKQKYFGRYDNFYNIRENQDGEPNINKKKLLSDIAKESSVHSASNEKID